MEVGASVPIKYAYEAKNILEKEFLAGGRGLPMKMKCDIAISASWDGDKLEFNDKHELVRG